MSSMSHVRYGRPIQVSSPIIGIARARFQTDIAAIIYLSMRFMLCKHGLNDRKDASVVAYALANMKATLTEGKVDLITSVLPFYLDPSSRGQRERYSPRSTQLPRPKSRSDRLRKL